jgi:hypothetical protein
MVMKLKNRRSARNNYDSSSVDSNSYSDACGGRKITDVGHHLKPIVVDPAVPSFTTDATTKKKVGKGVAIALFSAAGGTVTIGSDATIASLGAGVTDINGHVGIPVPANQWVYLNTYLYDSVITSAGVITFLIEDDTYIINTP